MQDHLIDPDPELPEVCPDDCGEENCPYRHFRVADDDEEYYCRNLTWYGI